ncbi:MAG TPA: hypothetical protein VGE65_09765 [Sphingobium sp.]
MHVGLIIWDLEGTLFGAAPDTSPFGALLEPRATLIRAFNDYGIASTICANSDGAAARARLNAAGLWDEFVLPRFDATDDAESVRQLIAEFDMVPGQVLLVDDDPQALQRARALMPDIRILNAAGEDADAILEAILVAHRRPWQTRSDIALLFGAQTRSIGQFSRLRHRIDFSAEARQFSLARMIAGPMVGMTFPPMIVYGAGLDYQDDRWPDLANLLDCDGLLDACIQQFCERVAADRARMLVVLPSAGDLAIPTVHLRRRTIRFNAAWRDAAQLHANIELLDMPNVPAGGAVQLKCLAGAIDDWSDGQQGSRAKVA